MGDSVNRTTEQCLITLSWTRNDSVQIIWIMTQAQWSKLNSLNKELAVYRAFNDKAAAKAVIHEIKQQIPFE